MNPETAVLFNPRRWMALAVILASIVPSQAQWLAQDFTLKAGWNAVYLHVDLTHTTLRDLIASDANNPIQEVWLWNPSSGTAQFVTSPQAPTTGSQWQSWDRQAPALSALQKLAGNSACLVRVSNDYVWSVKGKPTPPRYEWTSSGLNFFGFAAPSSQPPTFDAFLSQNPELLASAMLYRYVGGSIQSNPVLVDAYRTDTVQRGQALWINASGAFNRYFGPFEMDLPVAEGVAFGTASGQTHLVIRNVTANNLTVTLTLLDSETAPTGQTAIAGTPPLLLRGVRNPTDLSYASTVLNTTPGTFALKAKGQVGSEMEIVLGLNRSAMTGGPGGLYAGILRFTDSLGHLQVDVPVSASVASQAGLWVGQASVTQVQHYLKTYARKNDGTPVASATGQYVVTAENTSLGSVARPMPLRLIVHNDPAGAGPVLLQRVYYGVKPSGELAVATQQALLDPARLKSARRISAAHLPWTDLNTPWPLQGPFQVDGTVKATVALPYDDQASNPFIHSYHPDHDNLTADFATKRVQGEESYGVVREISLTPRASGADFDSLTTGSGAISGEYAETVTFNGKGTESRSFQVRGTFALSRISEISTLSKP